MSATDFSASQGEGFDKPIVFILFNRPELTREVFERIRAIRPRRLLVVADGPRSDRAGEAERCREARAVVESVDWPCEVSRDYSDANLGCKRRVSSGITWAFEQVEEAVILEDDCVPDLSFFRYASESLDRYRDDPRVMMVSGANFHPERTSIEDSYYFSNWGHIWAWATWRRAWKQYDLRMNQWPDFKRRRGLKGVLGRNNLVRYWERVFEATYQGEIDTWDNQWAFSMVCRGGLSIQPRMNLVTNIGFGPEATHTKTATAQAGQTAAKMSFPLRHPSQVQVNRTLDAMNQADRVDLRKRVWGRLKRALGMG